MRPRHLLLALAINLAWGLNNVAVKLSVMATEPLTTTLIRMAIVALVAAPWLRWVPGRMGSIALVAMGQGALHFALLNTGFAISDNPAALSLITQLGAPITLILAVLFLGERIRARRIAAIALAFAGVALIGFDPRLLAEREALWVVLVAVCAYSGATILIRRLRGVPAIVIVGWVGALSVPPLLAASLAFEPGELLRAAALPPLAFAPVVYSALGASMVGHLGLTWLTQRYPVSTVSPLFLPAPVIGAAVSTAVFRTPVTWTLLAGGLLVLVGVGIIAFRTGRVETAEART